MTTKNQAIKKALEPIQRDMFIRGYKQALEDVKKINIWHEDASQICINKKDLIKLEKSK